MPQELYLKSEGDFEVIVSKPKAGWLGQSKEKGTPYVLLQLTVDNDPEEDGKQIQWHGYLSDKAISNTIDTLVACFNFDGDLNSLYAGGQTLEGLRCKIVVEQEEYEGKSRYKVKWMNPIDYVHAPKSIAPETAKMLIAGLNGKTKAAALEAKANQGKVEEKARARLPLAPASAFSASEEDDVPF